MTSVPLNVTFDCTDGELVSTFWSQVTGWPVFKEEMPGNPYWVVGETQETLPRLVFVEVPESKGAKNRVHLDLLPRGSQDEEIARIRSLGGRVVEDRRDAAPGGWVVLADPEGNEFCLEPGVGD
jgi:predicted enzyme related to lactoylglutathione lyase